MKRAPLPSVLPAQQITCSAEAGSTEWCQDLQQKPRGEWTVNQAGDYAKHCLLNQAFANRPASDCKSGRPLTS